MLGNCSCNQIRACKRRWSLLLALSASLVAVPVSATPSQVDAAPTYDWVGWQFIGGISSGPMLDIGDVVKVRFIGEGNGAGKILSFGIEHEGQRGQWMAWLPELIEQADIGVRMGSVNIRGAFVDVPKNTSLYYYAVSPGTFSRVITEIHQVGGGLTTLPNLASPDQQDTLLFEAPAQVPRGREFSVRAGAIGSGKTGALHVQVFDVPSRQLLRHQEEVIDGSYAPSYKVTPPAELTGPLLVVANVHEWGESGRSYQKFHTVELTAAYDFIFPENVAGYSAGTRVLQPRDGRVYECRPFPYSGFCRQWSATDVQYEPGVGDSWQQAWTQQ